jgi:hypothetical protein
LQGEEKSGYGKALQMRPQVQNDEDQET